MTVISRKAYAELFGPTTGDRIRLADTDLWIEVEKDFTCYGDEVKFGGGKVIRDGMGQSQRSCAKSVDVVITNALVIDHWGIVKADIGIKNGRISGIGKAGNPDIQNKVDIIIGPGTEAITAEGLIVTAGGIDAHIHFRDLEIKNIPNIALSFRSDLIITIDKNRRLSRAMLRIFLNRDDRRWPEDGMRDG